MNAHTKEEILRAYRNANNPGVFPLIFAVPFTVCFVVFVVVAIHQLVNGNFLGGFLFLLVGAPVFALFAYGFGWGMYVHYIKTIGVIKQEKFVKVRAQCKSKTFRQDYRYHDSAEKDTLGLLTFQNETEKYSLEDWRTFREIEPDAEYLLIFLNSPNRIDAIINETTEEIVYFK